MGAVLEQPGLIAERGEQAAGERRDPAVGDLDELLDEHQQLAGRVGRGRLGDRHLLVEVPAVASRVALDQRLGEVALRSEEHTSELQSLMRTSAAVFCLKTKNTTLHTHT